MALTYCSKDKLNDTTIESKESEIEMRSIVNNFDFELFGKSHNAYLDFVDDPQIERTAEERYNFGKSFVDPYLPNTTQKRNAKTWQEFDQEAQVNDAIIDDIFSGNYSTANSYNFNFGSRMTNFLDNLADDLYQLYIDSLNTRAEDVTDLIQEYRQTIDTSLIEFDMELMEGNEEAGMLAMLVILDYSFDYWNEYYNAGSIDAVQTRFLKKVWRAIKIAAADTWGFLYDGWNEKDDGWWGSSGPAIEGAGNRSDRAGGN